MTTANGHYVLIVGMGATGQSVARYLARQGIVFAATDSRTMPPGVDGLASLADAPCHYGAFASPVPLTDIREAVVSPGIALDEPFVRELDAAGIPLVGDIELFAREMNASAAPPVIAITGSNGKSTVAALVAHMAETAGRRVGLGGNFGTPALDLLTESVDLYVLELSSFQLERTESLHSRAATVLNVSADHIDRHGDIDRYAAAKARIFAHTDTAVINRDDARVAAMPTAGARRLCFGDRPHPGCDGYGLRRAEGGTQLVRGDVELLDVAMLALRGGHNHRNALAALALGEAVGLPMPAMLAGLRSFAGLPHRCQPVATVAGVAYVNDSKGTNVGALCASLAGLQTPVVLLAGGQAKGGDFTPIAPLMARKGRGAVLFGADAGMIAAVLADQVPIRRANSMRSAVQTAATLAQSGDTVLLSPGCASFDMFANYRDRGEQFMNAVWELVS